MKLLSEIRERLREPKSILFLLLLLLTLLRVPNFSEPYWYGDEGIYLTIGNALREGGTLYTTIVDHKTPLIYYLAMIVDNQLQFRVLLYGMMLLSTAAFFSLCQTLFSRLKPAAFATLLFVVFTSLPWFEGHIPNGELFVISFVLYGAWLFVKTPVAQAFFLRKTVKTQKNFLLFAAGVSFGLALLTKVPALFDIIAFGAVFVFLIWREHFQLLTTRLKEAFVFVAGCLIPLVLSIVYFYAIGSGSDYLDFGLLYNFKYAGSWQLAFASPVVLFLFSLPGKTLVLGSILLLILGLNKKLSAASQFSLAWFWLSLFASLLSNRPYPHYFLQAIPPAAILVVLLIMQTRKISSASNAIKLTLLGGSLSTLLAVLVLLHVGLYSTVSYYTNWLRYMSKQTSRQEYYQSFDKLMSDNYAAAKLIITTQDKPSLFIWGTNPMLYALTKAVPPTRFTVSFHVADLDVYSETMSDVYSAQPEFIVVMNNESRNLPGLNAMLFEAYTLNAQYQHFTLWKRLSNASSLLY
ncbi:MAG: hypothetical protein GW946_01725 [Candidatus Pacebacteria bacterium]|nr:hypothetical protein [Candidatus Paceibacterota bacterium]